MTLGDDLFMPVLCMSRRWVLPLNPCDMWGILLVSVCCCCFVFVSSPCMPCWSTIVIIIFTRTLLRRMDTGGWHRDTLIGKIVNTESLLLWYSCCFVLLLLMLSLFYITAIIIIIIAIIISIIIIKTIISLSFSLLLQPSFHKRMRILILTLGGWMRLLNTSEH